MRLPRTDSKKFWPRLTGSLDGFPRQRHLGPMQPGVHAGSLHQVLMLAGLDDAATIEHDQPVGARRVLKRWAIAMVVRPWIR